MTTDGHGRTPIARMAQQQRALALHQQDSTLIPQMLLPSDDDSHGNLTARMRFLEACSDKSVSFRQATLTSDGRSAGFPLALGP